jgi:hypothetical protein
MPGETPTIAGHPGGGPAQVERLIAVRLYENSISPLGNSLHWMLNAGGVKK